MLSRFTNESAVNFDVMTMKTEEPNFLRIGKNGGGAPRNNEE